MAVLFRSTVTFLPLFFGAAMAQFFFRNPIVESPSRKPDFDTSYEGWWELVSLNSGVSAMHIVLLPHNKVIMFDATVFGPSNIQLPPGNCRFDPTNKETQEDCWAHAVEYDIVTGALRPLKILTDTWCSSGALSADGTLVQTGGWNEGGKAVRHLSPCDTCDWEEYPTALSVQRWYATQQILPDGSFIVVGGRRQFSYEYVPRAGESNPTNFRLPFLQETTDKVENNLYPFVHLSTDGNLFIFANNRSILLDPTSNTVVREFPILRGGSRNYPSSGMSVLLPIRLRGDQAGKVVSAEVLVCGGSPSWSAKLAAEGKFVPALQTCGRITITKADTVWRTELMPSSRVMGDMLLLPNTDVLMINGAMNGSAGWGFASEPNLEPLLYKTMKPQAERFVRLKPATIPRMYHSTSAVLPDGCILVAGSNTNNGYIFTGVPYPTEMRVEKFWPPYLDPLLAIHRPLIVYEFSMETIKYGQMFPIQIMLVEPDLNWSDLKVTMYAPPFTTHGYSMNQRLVVLRMREVVVVGPAMYKIVAMAPPTGAIAPPGYYLVFVVHRGVPSKGIWIRIE
ncbi:aldehyde oxidase GLOX1-like [Magnolia sinica]|uniref:aldehyde oxidase GLOX1-like n=1 Tax=Magnolia sinica TaxID=86752 RepID=UPI00265A871A|nr:aldehyde oxidase GLOX1-like [Magnolia sinica]